MYPNEVIEVLKPKKKGKVVVENDVMMEPEVPKAK
jgi:hypothetical protein